MNEATGTVYSSTTAGNGTVPAAEINTIADILSPCANSSMQTSMECSNLISATTYGGTTPSNTLGAILQIANYPANEVATLFSQKSANPPFQPILPTSPNDYSIGVTYSGNSLTQPGLLVVDANGAIWMANCQSCATPGATDSILEFDPTATGGDTFTTYTNSHIHSTQGLAFDNSGNLWTTNQAAGSAPDEVTKMTGNTLVGSYSGSDLSGPTAIAVDSSDRAWLSSTNNSNILWMSPSVTEMTGSPFLPSYTGIAAPYGIGLDNGGNVWVAATGTSSLLELSSIGTLESAAGGYTPSGLAGPVGVSIDSSNNIWTVDGGSTNAADVSEVSSSGTNVGGSPYSDFLYTAAVIAIDGSGQAWIPNCRSGCPSSGDSTDPDEILRLSNSGADNLGTNDSSNPGALSSIQKPGPSGFAGVASVAIDPGGNLWVANRFGGTITEVLGVATPVLTPVAAASKAGVLGSPAP
jgi:streptogramin lyase